MRRFRADCCGACRVGCVNLKRSSSLLVVNLYVTSLVPFLLGKEVARSLRGQVVDHWQLLPVVAGGVVLQVGLIEETAIKRFLPMLDPRQLLCRRIHLSDSMMLLMLHLALTTCRRLRTATVPVVIVNHVHTRHEALTEAAAIF